jgi:Histidinol dehydrogenase
MTVVSRCLNYGGLFIGTRAAEVLGDYGAGPNHVLPTGGTARYTGGLSVFNFVRVRTWMRIDDAAASQQVCSALSLQLLQLLYYYSYNFSCITGVAVLMHTMARDTRRYDSIAHAWCRNCCVA